LDYAEHLRSGNILRMSDIAWARVGCYAARSC
jgi:hypothetical protein